MVRKGLNDLKNIYISIVYYQFSQTHNEICKFSPNHQIFSGKSEQQGPKVIPAHDRSGQPSAQVGQFTIAIKSNLIHVKYSKNKDKPEHAN